MVRFIGMSIFLAYVGCALADTPLRPPAPFRVASPDGKIIAVADPSSGIKIIEASSGKQLWEMPGWRRVICISNDGEHLAIGYGGLNLINLDTDDSAEMIGFWHHGTKIKSVPLRAIVPDRSILRRTVSHYEWGYIRGINSIDQLEVVRVDGKLFRFNMRTGEEE